MSVIGLLLPYAVAVALSPVPIAAVILMVLSLRPGIGGAAFVAGWAVGLVVAVVLLTIVLGLLGLTAGGWVPALRLLLGVLLVLFAWERSGASRMPDAHEGGPSWVGALDRSTADRAFAMGALQAGLDPRKLLIIAAAGLLFAEARLALGDALLALVAFTIVGSLGVALPLVMARVGGVATRARLEAARSRLVEDNTTIQAVTLLLLGTLIAGQGLAAL